MDNDIIRCPICRGYSEWDFLDGDALNEAYTDKLMELRKCDTLFYILRRK